MPFRYRLESVLHLQRSLEKQEENRLLACVAQIASLRNEFETWEEERRNRKRLSAADLQAGSTGAALSLAAGWDVRVIRRQHEIVQQLARAEEARKAQVVQLQQERRKREVLESLKDRLATAYDQEELRRIQQIMDDMFLTRAFYYKG